MLGYPLSGCELEQYCTSAHAAVARPVIRHNCRSYAVMSPSFLPGCSGVSSLKTNPHATPQSEIVRSMALIGLLHGSGGVAWAGPGDEKWEFTEKSVEYLRDLSKRK